MNPAFGNLRALLIASLCSMSFAGQANADVSKPIVASVKQSLESKLATGMRIDTVKLDDKRANINGTAPSNAAISQFLRKVTESTSYTRVELVSLNQENTLIHFNIIADVKCPAAVNGNPGENLCIAPLVKTGSVFKCTQNGQTVFQDKPCATKAK